MKLISYFALADDRENYKAPKGMQYFVTSILFAVSNINVPTLIIASVKDYLQEESVSLGTGEHREAIGLYSWELDAGNNVSVGEPPMFQIVDINHKSKYLSIQYEISGAAQINIIIYGELVPISRTEAIVEWFRKGR